MKRILSMVIALLMLGTMIPFSVAAEEMNDSLPVEIEALDEEMSLKTESMIDSAHSGDSIENSLDTEESKENEPDDSFRCGNDLTWLFEDGILVINGTGDMYDYGAETEAPWYDLFWDISGIELGPDVTGIGTYAFYGCQNIPYFSVPNGIERIGDSAFCSDVRILGKPNTAAERFAQKNGNPFSALVSAPVLSTVSNSIRGVSVQWHAVNRAQLYRIYRRTKSTDWAVLGDSISSPFVDDTAESGKTYCYTVQCVSEDGIVETSTYDATGKRITYVAAPVIYSIAASNNGVHITWKKSIGAAKYYIFRKTDDDRWVKVGESPGTAYTDITADKGVLYRYTIRCTDIFGNYIGAYDALGKEFSFCDIPVISSVSNVAGGVRITWEQVTGAAFYCVYRKTGNSSWKRIGDTSEQFYMDTQVTSGRIYRYTVRCLGDDGSLKSDFDRTGKTITFLEPPVVSRIKNTAEGVQITWRAVQGSSKYCVFRQDDSGCWTLLGDTSTTSFTDMTVLSGNSYTYTVCCSDAAGILISDYDPKGVTIAYIATPVVSDISNTGDGVHITWQKVPGAAMYRVFRKIGSGNWTIAGDTDVTSFTDKSVRSGNSYSFTICCLDATGVARSDYDQKGKSITFIGVPVVSDVRNTVQGVRITWNKVPGALMYRVLRKTGSGSWEIAAETNQFSFTDRTTESGITYVYTVCCIDTSGNVVSAYDPEGRSIVCVAYIETPSITSVAASDGGAVITWGQISGSQKYRVFRKTTGEDWKALADTASTSYTDKSATYGIAYFYTVRCVNAAGDYISDYDSSGWRFVLATAPVLKTLSNDFNGVKVSWSKVNGGEKYRVFRRTGNGVWSVVADTTAESVTDKTAVNGTTYSYTVRCVNSKGDYNSDYDAVGRSITFYAPPSVTSAVNVIDGVRITWGKTAWAAQYRVFRRTASSAWKSIGETNRTYFLDTDVTASEEYFYAVCCLDSTGNCISGYDPTGISNKVAKISKKIYLSPSNQEENTFITGNANEGEVWNDIASRLVALLAAYDCEVVLSDYDMRLAERAEEANQWGADVYIAMHSNAYTKPNTCWGVEVYYDANKTNSAERKALAEAFLNELTALFTNRGLRTASNLSDCWRPEMPSVIVECGYHDTVSDANRILNNKDLIAQLYCNALVKYLGLVRKA